MTRPFAVAISARIAAVRLPVPGALYHLPDPLGWRLTRPLQPGFERAGTTARALTLLHDLEPDSEYRLDVEGLAPLDFRTRRCGGLLDAAAFGLHADVAHDDVEKAHDNARVLAAALARVPDGGCLFLPRGIWTAMPIRLRSNLTLHLAEGAVLRAPSLRDRWPILSAHDEHGQMLGSWEGLPDRCYAAPLHAVEANGLTIEGRGVIDGSGAAGDWWLWPKETRDGARRPRGLHLVRCEDVTLMGFAIRNAASWTIHPQGCDGLTAAGLSISAPHDSPNTDGFNPEGCRNVIIEGVHFSVGDDCIAIKAGKRDANGGSDHLRETRHVEIRHCLMERGHGGVVIGSEMSGGVHDVRVEDCEMRGTDRGLRLKTRRGRGGIISGIAMRRVRMDGVLTALSANAFYFCDGDGHADWVQSRSAAPVDGATPLIEDITAEDIDIFRLALATGVFLGLPEQPIRRVVIRRLRLHSTDPDALEAVPIMADHVRPMRHETILREHAEIECDDPALLSAGTISVTTPRADP